MFTHTHARAHTLFCHDTKLITLVQMYDPAQGQAKSLITAIINQTDIVPDMN